MLAAAHEADLAAARQAGLAAAFISRPLEPGPGIPGAGVAHQAVGPVRIVHHRTRRPDVTRAAPKAQIRLFRSLRRQPLDDPAAACLPGGSGSGRADHPAIPARTRRGTAAPGSRPSAAAGEHRLRRGGVVERILAGCGAYQGRRCGSDGDGDLAACLPGCELTHGLPNLVQWVGRADARGDCASLEELGDPFEVAGALPGDEHGQPLVQER